MVDSAKPRFTCSECSKSFSRAEHLTRHQALHDGSQAFSCDRCDKQFPRKDALTRHVLTHDGGPNLLEKKARACRACAKSKVRCSGEPPCSRCSNKAIECEFPAPRPHHTQGSPTTVLPSPESDVVNAPSEHGDHRSIHILNLCNSPDLRREVPQIDTRASISTTGGTYDLQPVNSNNSYSTEPPRFDPGYWTPTVLSSINWLPTSESMSYDNVNQLSPIPLLPSPHYNHAIPSGLDSMSQIHRVGSLSTPRTVSSTTETMSRRSTWSGEYYVDGDAGRLPRIKRQKIIARRPSELRSPEFGYRLAWAPLMASEEPVGPHFAEFEYEDMHRAFMTLCVNCAPVTPSFISSEFPSLEAFDYLIHLFFKHVHQSLPFVHRPTFNPDHEGRWILLLSMASISCWFLEDEIADEFAESLLEFLRRVTLFFDASNGWQRTFTNCRHAQIVVLLLLSASASKHESVKMWSDRCVGELCYLVNSSICRSYPKGQYERAGMPPSAEWLVWSEDEQTRRTAFLVWQIGFLKFMQNADGRPPVTLDSIASIRLPCTDAMFEAEDAETWQELEARSSRATFLEALQNLYIDKKLLPELGDFSHTLLIYGVIQRTREVQDHVQQPLSRFEPSAEKRRSSEMNIQPVWAPSVPVYMKWRNSACDCLDILHWQANAAIGMAAGLEPAKVMHLHFARILMLVPLDQLLGLARMINIPFASSADTGKSSPEEIEMKRAIQRWAISDQYKARLAAIHAGVTFWHVRRYSTNAHYEPFAVLGATLTLWALSTFSPRLQSYDQSPRLAEAQETDTCEIILIDRPTDDELVQQFVRDGLKMRVHMTGVDDLWAPAAPYRVLREGKKLLARLGAWAGETDRAITLLDGLMMARFREM